jgi:threo-3-hydroxy-L-aspartate ammonia-lyase
MAGCSTVARALASDMAIIGVEADTANDTYLSPQKGERVTIAPPPTIADGIRITTPGTLTLPILQANRVEVVLVTDDEIRAAVRALELSASIVAEPTGAVGAASVLAGELALRPGARVGIVLSGGNIDPAMLVEILRRN